MFEFIATLAFADPGTLLTIQDGWARGEASDGGSPSESLEPVMAALREYDVAPPVELLGNFPAPSLMLTAMRLLLDELEQSEAGLREVNPELAQQLGLVA